MKINIVGSNTVGYVGEKADELLIADAFRRLNHEVSFIPRDIWKAHVDGHTNPDWDQYLNDLTADVNIVCKWHHFSEGKYALQLREESGAPVIYWTWDFMDYDENFHTNMAKASDLFITNDHAHTEGVKSYYFPFDVADDQIKRFEGITKNIDVVFFGSHMAKGDRVAWIKEINKVHPVVVYSYNYQLWQQDGIAAQPAVYGDAFARIVSQAKIILQFSVNDHCWGYWSNRVGKVLTQGGFLLARYAPGMELFLRDGAAYFSSVEEANQKIEFYLNRSLERQRIADRGYEIGKSRFSVIERVKDLEILVERFLKNGL